MITHKTSAVAVFQSTDYGMFAMMKGNRILNQDKIKRIIKDIEAGNDMLPYYPIQVRAEDGKLTILDGQHRFFICKRLQKPVHYIIVIEKKSMLDIAKINSNVEKWKQADFFNCYITAGINDYAVLLNYIKEYGFSLGVCLELLTTGDPGSVTGSNRNLHQRFAEGLFKVEKLDEAKQFGDLCKMFSAFPYHRSRNFVIALYRIKKAAKIEIEELAAAFNKNPGMLKEQPNFKDYIVNLEQVINVNKKQRVIIA